MKNNLIASCLITLLFVSCNSTPQYFDFGEIVNDEVYINNFFDLNIPLGDEWLSVSDGLQGWIAENGSYYIKDEENPAVDYRDVDDASLLFMKEVVFDDRMPTSVILMAENLVGLNHIETASDYLDFSREELESAPEMKIVSSEYDLLMIDGVAFSGADAQIDRHNGSLQQSYYSCIKNGFALSFIATYQGGEERLQFLDFLQTLTFTEKMDSEE